MQRVAKSSRFDLVIQASWIAVIMRASEGSGKQDIVRLRNDRALACEYRMPACADIDGARIHTAILK
jgi:hypothetical protein